MQVKTFEGRSLSQLTAQIKKELGPEAVILSTEQISQNGKTIYKILAAKETVQPNTSAETLLSPSNSNHPQWLKEFWQEWDCFKDHLLTLLQPEARLQIPPKYTQAINYLKKQGVKKEIIFKLLMELSQEKNASLVSLLKKLLPSKPWPKFFVSNKIHFFLGPSGSGQTSALLKLIFTLKQEQKKILLAYPLSGTLQNKLYLEHYAQLTNLDFQTIEPENIPNLLTLDYDLIFVDLPHQATHFQPFINKAQELNVDVHSILSPVYAEDFLISFLSPIKNVISSIIWTRLDEGENLGPIINLEEKFKLPISFCTYGAQLKESSRAPTSEELLRFIFKREFKN